jgi:hypothetical protein
MIPINRMLLPIGVAVLLLAGCGSAVPPVTLADKSLMPEKVMMQSERVQEAYRFAVSQPEDLETIPCYCGCVGLNHRNNLECYLKPESTPEALVFDDHALGCEICADTTHLTMRLLKLGLSPADIRDNVDRNFAERGVSTDTPYPTESDISENM